MGDSNKEVSRRTYMKYAGVAGTAGVTGLVEQDQQMELIHHWTRGADGEAMSAFLEEFENQHDVSIEEKTPSGQAGKNVRTIVQQRLLNDNPPASWQALAGKDQMPFVSRLKDVEQEVWNTQGMKDAYLPGPKRAAKLQGNFVEVPPNVHRLNAMYYNTSILDEAGVDPSSLTDLQALGDAFETISSETDAVPMSKSISEPWTVLAFWETLFLSTAGLEKYQTFADGNVSEVESEVKQSLELLNQYKDYFPEDANAIAWPEAASMVANGEAAFYQNGDWAVGVLLGVEDFEFKEDWDWIPVPGTSDYFSIVMDAFVWPKNNPSPDATRKFLQWCGSKEGQAILNSIKGSIPPRTDVPRDRFSGYQVDQMDSITQTEAQPLNITFTHAVTPEVSSNLKEAVGQFTANWNVDRAYQRFQDSFSQ